MDEVIMADLKPSYGLNCAEIVPISGGWLNRKWKAVTEQREVLVKQFSNRRFSREKLQEIEKALQRQVILRRNGVRCPRVLLCQGLAIRQPDPETSYMVMEFCAGKEENPHTITIDQMRSLGDACGFMHQAFSRLPIQAVKGYPVSGGQILNQLKIHLQDCRQKWIQDGSVKFRRAVWDQERIAKQLDPAFFDRLPKGIAHEDFSADNILFHTEEVSAIVDFDRNQYSFLWHDIGRAVLTFALKDGKLDTGIAKAFVEGYCRHQEFSVPDLGDALRLSWCLEVPWWIRPECFCTEEAKVARFRDEMLWLTRHWFELDRLLQ